jgi:hypothetical protein
MSLAARQALLAQFLDDPQVEEAVRRDPERVAQERGVPADFVAWLAGLDPHRVVAFRRSRVHKDAMRGGQKPKRV